MANEDKSPGIQVISRAANILRTLGRDSDGLSLGQIATAVSLPRSTVQRIVNALAAEGLVAVRENGNGIRIGPEIQSLAEASKIDMSKRLRPVMEAIAEETGETVDLSVYDGGDMRFIDQVIGQHRLRAVSKIGESFPMTCTANGKAALALLDWALVEELVNWDFGDRGYVDPREVGPVFDEVKAVRDGELAVDDQEYTEGISALGFAVKDRDDGIFAISVPVPSSRFPQVRDSLEKVLKRWWSKIELGEV